MTTSYWQEQLNLVEDSSELSAPVQLETELCVIGAGIIGAGTAYWASRHGVRGVVVEARKAAAGASGRNAGFVLSGIADNYYSAVRKYGRDTARDLWALSIENRDTMMSFAERYGAPLDRCGSLLLAESEREAEELARSAELLAEDGFAGDFTPTDPLQRGFFAGLNRPDDGVTQPARLTRAILAESGFELLEGSPVLDFEEREGRVIIRSERATISARWLFIATNGWSNQLHPYFAGRVVPMRGQIYVTEPTPMIFHTAGYSHFGYWYFRQVPEPDRPGYGRWLIGGGRHLHFPTENNNPSEEIHGPVQGDLEAWTAEHFPEFSHLSITHRWAGIMGFTADGLPLVGRLPGHERTGFSVGFNGHGMGLGVLVARRALDMLLHNTDPGIFRADRAPAAS